MTIERAISQRSVLQENDNLRAQLDRRYGMDNIVGRDPRMLKVFEMIGSVADTRATVLVTGESGTGKSMIARAIHRRSGRVERAVRRSGLRCAAGNTAGKRTVRPRRRRVHRRGRRKDGQVPASRRRHDLPRRNRHRQPGHASEAAPRAARAEVRASRRHEDVRRRCPRRAGDERRPVAGRGRRPLPPGPVLPRQRHQHRAAAAAHASERHPDARAQLPGTSSRRLAPRGDRLRRRCDGHAGALPLAGQRSRAAKRRRAGGAAGQRPGHYGGRPADGSPRHRRACS